MFNLADLESSLSSIAEIGKGEMEFEVNNIKLAIRVLQSHEEIEIQKYAYEAVKNAGEGNDSAATMEYFDRFRLATMAYAIIGINNEDFRGVSTIETGETLPNGKKIQIPKHEAMRKVLSKFSRTIMIAMFKKYSELVEKTEIDAEKYIQFSVDDFDSEVERLEARLVEIKKAREDKLKKEKDDISQKIKNLASVGKVELKDPEAQDQSEEVSDFEAEVAEENVRLLEQAGMKQKE
jgi:hypothetical protein